MRLKLPAAALTLTRLDPRVYIVGFLIAALCATFWSGSRYPSLQGKASADPDDALATPLGFEQHFAEPGAHEPIKHVLWSALEWAVTNKQGMTFGLLLAAALLTLIPLVRGSLGGRFAGSLQGALLGAPLGVCVNCAAPIGQAMLKGGSRVEVALATMFASPSFNVIVLGILLSLFPLYLVALKLAASVLMVLAIVPVLGHLAERPGWRRPPRAPARLPGLRAFQWLESALGASDKALLSAQGEQAKGWGHAVLWVLIRYPVNLWTVIRLALPLMLLAGLIGAALAELLPWGMIAQMAQVEGWAPNVALLLGVALFGVILPVPIAFDVIICAVLWDVGVPPHLIAALLVTLGLYSVYPFSLLGTTLSWRLAASAGVAVLLLGVGAGAAAGVLHNWHELRLARTTAQQLAVLPVPDPQRPVLPPGRSFQELAGAALPLPAFSRIRAEQGVELLGAEFRRAGEASGGFTRFEGAQVGFERLPLPRPYVVMEPGVMHLNPLAAGDVDGDGWPDVVLGSPFGVMLYRNLGGRFVQQSIDFPAMRDWIISEVALADLDGDGAPELIFSSWRQGTHILFNRQGAYSQAHYRRLPDTGETTVNALAFADLDRDGDLDMVTGTIVYVPRFFYPQDAVNHLWRNDGQGGLSPEELAGPQGESLTLLFHDFDADGWPDLFVGNDYDEPDRIYRNNQGQLQALSGAQLPLARSTHDTMSADSGDLDNDGQPELYLAQIAMGLANADFADRSLAPLQSCGVYGDIADRVRCDALSRFQLAVFGGYMRQDLDFCLNLVDLTERRDCLVSAYHWNRVLARLPVLGADRARILQECDKIPADFISMRDICSAISRSPMDHEESDQAFPGELASVRRTNLLLSPDPNGYREITQDWGAALGGWSWNAKFADLDNDSWQDLFITQGTRLRPKSVSAVYYHNRQGRGFDDLTAEKGLKDHNPTSSSLFLDYDLDGDLDLISFPLMLSPVLWRNDLPAGQGFELALHDERSANRSAIGARIEIRGGDGRLQMRDIKGSGGYQSHDLAVARFGLGDWPAVEALRVSWPDGTVTQLDGLSLTAGRYQLRRTR